MSSLLRILYSLPSSLISVPPYLLTSRRSPFLTSNGTFLPLSSVLPVPSATMTLSIGFSFAESGMMIPPFFVSFSSAGSTSTRSPRGFRFTAIVLFCCVYYLFRVKQSPQHSLPGKMKGHNPSGIVVRKLFFLIHDFGVDHAFVFLAFRLGCSRAGRIGLGS